MRIACESVADNELCPLNALASALTAYRRMTSHMDMLRRSNNRLSLARVAGRRNSESRKELEEKELEEKRARRNKKKEMGTSNV
jgi:hypothetical protein